MKEEYWDVNCLQEDKGKVKCNLCDKELGDERTLLNHVENTHILTMESRERKYQCKVMLKMAFLILAVLNYIIFSHNAG